ncbi:hypothetical protein ABZ924_28005, partial [Streptomyces sp. NPDC046876]|uniref:hypothetical protein n=1 Tax=Streptomyces sp. NPDC046876 TaxID=3155616 RepID=UPI0034052D5A
MRLPPPGKSLHFHAKASLWGLHVEASVELPVQYGRMPVPLEAISFGWLGRLSVVVGIVERLVPDELWELFQ